MPISSTRVNNDKAANDNSYKGYLKRHQAALVNLIRDGNHSSETGIAFVEQVLNEWSEHFAQLPLEEATPEERSFWYTLYLMEQVAEDASYGAPECSYIAEMKAELLEMATLLEDCSDIPEGCWATRPNGD